ncbi:MAG: hypothetical protein K6F35_00550 [Lachnospiraceae bacterium]|nr:hypothetical protein [Lachnospiraceae bacterium]
MQKTSAHYKIILPAVPALIHTAISFFTDRLIFTQDPSGMLHNYIPCKLLMFLALYFFWRFLFFGNRKMLKYSLIYLIPMIAVCLFKLPQGFLSNDERLIFEQAAALADYTWFYYLTTWYYIISMMILPAWFGPILVKLVLELLVCGYCLQRFTDYLDAKYGCLLYAGFLLPPILAYTTSAHRIPIYIFIYLVLMVMMLMDFLQGIVPGRMKLCGELFLIALLTQWRTEGIYLALLGPVLMLTAYPSLRKSSGSVLKLLAASLLIQYLIAIPQYGILPNRMGDKADNRMGPFYAYTVTNMFRNGLDLEKNAEDLKQIDRFLRVETIQAINDELGDINYEDALILYYPGFTGVREEAGDEDYKAYVEASKRLFRNNPGVLLKTKLGSFDYAATVYEIRWEEGGIRGFAKFLVSIVKTVSYNLYIPMLLLAVLFLYSIAKRRPFTFFLCSCLLGHWFIVFVLAPASYFKYYFPVYFTTYFWWIMIGIAALYDRRTKPTSGSVRNPAPSSHQIIC